MTRRMRIDVAIDDESLAHLELERDTHEKKGAQNLYRVWADGHEVRGIWHTEGAGSLFLAARALSQYWGSKLE